MTVELVVLAPVLLILSLLIVHLGRAGGASQQVRHAADAAARAASIVATSRMRDEAESAARADLEANGVNCASTSVAVRIGGPPSLRTVTVTVSCTTNSAGLDLLGVGGRSVRASSTEVVDRYRGGE
jgi:Flp pilus assembly protein TadG